MSKKYIARLIELSEKQPEKCCSMKGGPDMALVRAFVKVDDNRTVTPPLISSEGRLQLDTGTVVELKVHGARKSTYVTMHKRKMVR